MKYLIWSWEHQAWWMPNSSGYTTQPDEAGRYTVLEAATITVDVIPAGSEVAISEQEARMLGYRMNEWSHDATRGE